MPLESSAILCSGDVLLCCTDWRRASVSGSLVDRRELPFAKTFVMRRATGDRWLNVGVLPVATGG